MNFASCRNSEECEGIADSTCVQPFSTDNRTRLIRIGHSDGPTVLFVGSIEEVARTGKSTLRKSLRPRSFVLVMIQSHQSTSFYLPNFFVTDFSLLVQYVAAISFALAFFNAVPCHAFDGQFILSALLNKSPRSILFVGSTLVVGNIALALILYFCSFF